MDITAMCEVLRATQQADGEARKKAEQQLTAAASDSPNPLVQSLAGVLREMQIPAELRLEAAVLLRQLVQGNSTRESVWSDLEASVQQGLMAQMLELIAAAPEAVSRELRRSAAQVVVAITEEVTDLSDELTPFDELKRAWPAFLPAIAKLSSSVSAVPLRLVALEVLRELSAGILEGFLEMANRAELAGMLAAMLSDASMDVRVAGARLACSMISKIEDSVLLESTPEIQAPLVQVMPSIVSVLQSLANSTQEDHLCDLLEALKTAAKDYSHFFRECLVFQPLVQTVMKIASVGPETFAEERVRQEAMDILVEFAKNLVEDVCKPEGQPLLEALLNLNIQWMMEVEEDVEAWTKEGQDKDEDDCDDEVVGFGEENLDSLAEAFCEDEDVEEDDLTSDKENMFMALLLKVIRAAEARPDATWKTTRSCIMALAQIAEHLTDENLVDQIMTFVMPKLVHAHPRVRYAAFWCVSQVCYDQPEHVPETYCEELLQAIVVGMDDSNIRVVTQAVSAFSSLGEELDADDIEPAMDDLLGRLFNRLHQGESQALQENCLSGIAVIAEASDEHFVPYYSRAMPMLKQVVAKSTAEEQRPLQAKAYECISSIGAVVGRELFLGDAKEVLEALLPQVANGFDAEDPRREKFNEATIKIAGILGKDMKPYIGPLLPSLFETLKQKAVEAVGEDIDDDSDDEELNLLGISTGVLEEIEEALELLQTLVEAVGEDFCDFLPTTCQNLLPLFDKSLNRRFLEELFKTWEILAASARSSAVAGRLPADVLRELVTTFLQKTVGSLVKTAQGVSNKLSSRELEIMQMYAAGVAGVVKKAGEGTLTAEAVKDMAGIVSQLLSNIPCKEAEPGFFRRRGGPEQPDDDDDEDERGIQDDTEVNEQSVRFALSDVMGALAGANAQAFVEAALPAHMELVKALVRPERSEADRALGFYITEEMVSLLGDKTVPYWNGFMNEALMSIVDKSPLVRQYAAGTIGSGSPLPIFAQVAPAAASQVVQVLRKLGERHRRRRAVGKAAVQAALGVDACIRALGRICEHQEQALGADAATGWAMWLTNLPIKYSVDAGKAAHEQLVQLVVRNHGALCAPQQLPKVLNIFADIYKSKFSSPELDKKISAAVASVGEGNLEQLCSGFTEKTKKKVKTIVSAQAGA